MHAYDSDESPITVKQIVSWTRTDPLLSAVVRRNWSLPHELHDEAKPFQLRKLEFLHAGCLLWGNRVVVPTQGRHVIMDELNDSHPGIVSMKAIARSHVW